MLDDERRSSDSVAGVLLYWKLPPLQSGRSPSFRRLPVSSVLKEAYIGVLEANSSSSCNKHDKAYLTIHFFGFLSKQRTVFVTQWFCYTCEA